MEPLASYLIQQDMTRTARSALPDAPVVPHVDRAPVLVRTRATVAAALQRLATVIAPPECVSPSHS